MAIPGYFALNFQTMLRAAKDGQLALVECTDARTHEPVYVVAMVNSPDEEHDTYDLVPVARMLVDPYEDVIPPDGGTDAPAQA